MRTTLTTILYLCVGLSLSCPTLDFELSNTERVIVHSKLANSTVATAHFTNALQQTGWTILSINTSLHFTDTVQLFHAGYLEGYLTADLINDAYYNFLNSVLDGKEIIAEQQQFIDNQMKWMEYKVRTWKDGDNGYWGLVGSLLEQLNGLYRGYSDKMTQNNRNNETLSFNQFYYLTNMGDLQDITKAILKQTRTEMNCDAFVKLTEQDLICSHNTFNKYSLMLRVYKEYHFEFQNRDVLAHFQAFSSRPGDLESKDDFYILNTNLVVMETSLNNYNTSNSEFLHYESVPCWIRVNLANRLASNGSEWADIFSQHRSGTHNNQWIIVDYNQFKANKDTDIIWMVEESFALYKSVDFTQQLLQQGYIASYNVPYNQDIYDSTMYQQGYGYNYTNDPRAILFKKASQNLTSIRDVMQAIRSNSNSTGDPSNALSPRYDLLNTDAFTYGGIDGKVVNQELLEKGQSYIISGPTSDGLSFFDWRNWESVAHKGMPDVFDFSWIQYESVNHSYSFVDLNSTSQLSNIQIHSSFKQF